ncbi:hypothetical protein GCM10010222_69770 [Streptomyces tanashiensis]|uniref:hypothetical protein n=1 Tax=Streptomyces tanashiensis TaxID=67367 RepID=UPI0019A149A2|nr:hypothetical protein [Streptomyces tanashiensis]GGT17901.1 hypothetical protein GCM10010222_69770 [Streptomyces tanashiensis]
MSQEAAPERAVPEQPVSQSVPEQKGAGAPKGLLQQMEELMAALSADLSQLDADLQSTSDRLAAEPPTQREPSTRPESRQQPESQQ